MCFHQVQSCQVQSERRFVAENSLSPITAAIPCHNIVRCGCSSQPGETLRGPVNVLARSALHSGTNTNLPHKSKRDWLLCWCCQRHRFPHVLCLSADFLMKERGVWVCRAPFLYCVLSVQQLSMEALELAYSCTCPASQPAPCWCGSTEPAGKPRWCTPRTLGNSTVLFAGTCSRCLSVMHSLIPNWKGFV